MRKVFKSNTVFYPINSAGNVIGTKGCNSITFYNTGNGEMLINDSLVIGPNTSFTVSMPHPEMYDATLYRVGFQNGTDNRGVAIMVFANPVMVDEVVASGKEICEKY